MTVKVLMNDTVVDTFTNVSKVRSAYKARSGPPWLIILDDGTSRKVDAMGSGSIALYINSPE